MSLREAFTSKNFLPVTNEYHSAVMCCVILPRDNLMIPIQKQLSQKQKTFSQFFAVFLKSRLNFEHVSYSLVTGNKFLFGKVSLSDMPNLGTAC